MSASDSVQLEAAVGAGAPGVDHPLGDALVVEVHDLLAEVVVLEQGRAPGPDPQAVVGVGDGNAGHRGEDVALLGPSGMKRLVPGRLPDLAVAAHAASLRRCRVPSPS